jgi:excisionase family DNA binding protein
MSRQDAKKQEFIAAIQVVAATLAELWWDGGSSQPPAYLMPASTDDDDRMLSRQDVATMLDVSTSTVDRLAKAGELTPIKVTGRNPKFRRSDVQRYLRRRRE